MATIGTPSQAFVQEEWANRILPAYRRSYPEGDFPNVLTVVPGRFFDGFGAPGLVAIDQAVASENATAVRLFALAHETAHCVVYKECEAQHLQVPNTDNGPNKKKHEMMADLIAVRVLREHLASSATEVLSNLDAIAQKLGAGDGEHPSGVERTRLIKRYVSGADFGTLFQAIVAGVPV